MSDLNLYKIPSVADDNSSAIQDIVDTLGSTKSSTGSGSTTETKSTGITEQQVRDIFNQLNTGVTEERVRALIESTSRFKTGTNILMDGYLKSQNFYTGVSGWQIDADGNVEFGSGYFRGDITGASGTFSGTITATTGSIGGFTIGANAIYAGDGATKIQLDTSQGIFLGANTLATAPFSVSLAGVLTATSGTIGGWILGTDLLKSATSGVRIELDKGNNRISIFDATNEKVVMGYLNGLPKHDGTGNWGASNYGFWARTGDMLSIDGDSEYVSGDWLIQNDASYLVKDGSNNTIIRLGTDTGEKGLFIYNTAGTQLAKFISTAIYVGTAGNSLSYTVAGGLVIEGNITATTGAIGGFTIGSDYIKDAADSFGLSSTVSAGDDIRFWAGSTFTNRATAAFHLSESGSLFTKKLSVNNFVDCLDGSITYSGTWTETGSNVSLHNHDKRSATVGEYFEITFFGTDIGLVLGLGGNRGKVDIYIDTSFDSTVDLYADPNLRSIAYQKNGLTNASHVLRGVVATKNGSSSANIVPLTGYSLSPNKGIFVESISSFLNVAGVSLTTDANGYVAYSPTPLTGYSIINIAGVALTEAVMSDATLTDPKLAVFLGTVYLYNGAANTTYTVNITQLISSY